MRTQEAKAIPLEVLLTRMGHRPHHQVRGDLWYVSPLRDEREPSFKVDTRQNVWFDYGIWEGGNNLDFIRHHFDIPEHAIPAMLRRVEGIMGGFTVSDVVIPEPLEQVSASASRERDIKRVSSLQNSVLLRYLREQRGISAATAKPYLKEIYWIHKSKTYFALAFPNNTGGYELRNAYYKGTEGAKNISIIDPETRKIVTDEQRMEGLKADAVTVFEGFMDFLSALEHYGRPITTPVVVMNGLGMKYRTLDAIEAMIGVEKVYLYLDRDKEGRETSAFLEKGLSPRCTVLDNSSLYADYDDFNKFLVAQKEIEHTPEHQPA